MIDFYFWPTPNGWKISIMLEECGLEYNLIKINIAHGDQFKPEFITISPNNRIPAIVDNDAQDGPVSVFESGAILIYLAEKTGRFMPQDLSQRYDAIQWVFWQMANLGPMAGQFAYFRNYSEDKIESAIDRFGNEYNRLLGVMDRRLADRDYLAGNYSIADIASWPWVLSHDRLGQSLDDFPNVKRWLDSVGERPAVQKGFQLGLDWARPPKPGDAARGKLFNQTADSVAELIQEASGDTS